MSKIAFNVTINPEETLRIIKQNHTASLVYDEYIDLNNGKGIGTLIYEKYFIRNSNRAALTVICDNVQGRTEVRAIATGASQGMFISFDWGASNEFANSVHRILKDYIIEY
ncbi:MAG TPA: hypothetical protein DCG34_09855 [Clostridiales bacterium]|jgi:hypothetical protein|nr:hypothetical protein [Clostridiales bacterium]